METAAALFFCNRFVKKMRALVVDCILRCAIKSELAGAGFKSTKAKTSSRYYTKKD